MADSSGGHDDEGSSRVPSPLLPSSFSHTPFYCEENVYLLCKTLSMLGLADPKAIDLFVVFISNEERKVPLLYQKASKRFDGLVVWDYHVICIQSQINGEGNARNLVWDLDSSLPLPLSLNQYVSEAFQPVAALNFTRNRLFRVVHAPIFIRCFASDRSHMRDPIGNWYSLPPIHEPIVAEDGAVNNLDEYIKMSPADATTTDVKSLVDGVFSNKFGVVIREPMLGSFFDQIHLLAGATK